MGIQQTTEEMWKKHMAWCGHIIRASKGDSKNSTAMLPSKKE